MTKSEIVNSIHNMADENDNNLRQPTQIRERERVYDKYQRSVLLTHISGRIWRCKTTGEILILRDVWVDYGICLFYFTEYVKNV